MTRSSDGSDSPHSESSESFDQKDQELLTHLNHLMVEIIGALKWRNRLDPIAAEVAPHAGTVGDATIAAPIRVHARAEMIIDELGPEHPIRYGADLFHIKKPP